MLCRGAVRVRGRDAAGGGAWRLPSALTDSAGGAASVAAAARPGPGLSQLSPVRERGKGRASSLQNDPWPQNRFQRGLPWFASRSQFTQLERPLSGACSLVLLKEKAQQAEGQGQVLPRVGVSAPLAPGAS